MNYPHIENIDDLLPYIENKDEIKVKHNNGYITVDYQVQKENTFDSDMARECRGLKFYPDGTIAARPFHKFFNRGEHPEFEPDSEPSRIEEKIDGSLVHNFVYSDGSWNLMTKAGITEVSKMAETIFPEGFEFMMQSYPYTHMFEFVSPENRIVLFYPKAALIYLGSRNVVTGEYVHFPVLTEKFGAPKQYTSNDLANVKDWVDHEGAVLVWPNGERLKVKSDDYVLKHKTKDSLSQEKNVLHAVLNDDVDDLVGILNDEDFDRVRAYEDDVWYGIKEAAGYINGFVEQATNYCGDDRACIAKQFVPQLDDKALVSVFWQVLNGNDAESVIVDMLKRNCTKQRTIDDKRSLVGCKWYEYYTGFVEE